MTITWCPDGHPMRGECRVCWLLAQPPTSPCGAIYREHYRAGERGHEDNDNAWSGTNAAGVKIGSHLTVEQMCALELGERRYINRGTRFTMADRLTLGVYFALVDDRRRLGAQGEVVRTLARICPAASRWPPSIVAWAQAQAQRQKQLVDSSLARYGYPPGFITGTDVDDMITRLEAE